jgi:DNA-directed RNA polymerase subunit RPC12/RpoP
MYEKHDLWPIACPKCRHEFTEKIEHMEIADKLRCPSCKFNASHPRQQFLVALAQARAGAFNPWRAMMDIQRLA